MSGVGSWDDGKRTDYSEIFEALFSGRDFEEARRQTERLREARNVDRFFEGLGLYAERSERDVPPVEPLVRLATSAELERELSSLGTDALRRLEVQAAELADPNHEAPPQGLRVLLGSPDTQALLRELARDPQERFRLDPRTFEYVVGELLERLGYNVEITSQTRDGGYDVLAYRTDFEGRRTVLVECKRYSPSRTVGRPIVQQLYGVCMGLAATQGLIVTTSRFSRDAEEWASERRNQVQLRDGDELIDLVRRVLSGREGVN